MRCSTRCRGRFTPKQPGTATLYVLDRAVMLTRSTFENDAEARAKSRGCRCVSPVFEHRYGLHWGGVDGVTTVRHTDPRCPLREPAK